MDSKGWSWFCDVIAFHDNKTILNIEPTIIFEITNPDQTDQVNEEKKKIYENRIDFYKE